ncbi:MAG TPA: twin-arginine translocase TatA/TatE family subunit [Bacteroidales bacterium]|nr:twin-arginine translocase TatA/TatE family subunit [Bacteroidales bacterium]
MNYHIITAWAPGAFEIIVILVVILLLFGGRKIPELMRGIGKGIKEFKDGVKDDEKPDDNPKD